MNSYLKKILNDESKNESKIIIRNNMLLKSFLRMGKMDYYGNKIFFQDQGI